MLTTSLDDLIVSTIQSLLEDVGLADEGSVQVRAEQTLTEDLGLTSLTLARLIAQINHASGRDPFRSDHSIADVRTVADLLSAYAQSAGALL